MKKCKKYDFAAGISGAIGALAGLNIPRLYPAIPWLQTIYAGMAIAVIASVLSYSIIMTFSKRKEKQGLSDERL